MKTGACLVLAAAIAIAQEDGKHDLSFASKQGDRLVVSFAEDCQWDYKDSERKGTLRTELTLRWTFEGEGRAAATYDRVVYRGEGTSKDKKWAQNIEWSAKDGYVKGKAADYESVGKEIEEGVKFKIDGRGECSDGQC